MSVLSCLAPSDSARIGPEYEENPSSVLGAPPRRCGRWRRTRTIDIDGHARSVSISVRRLGIKPDRRRRLDRPDQGTEAGLVSPLPCQEQDGLQDMQGTQNKGKFLYAGRTTAEHVFRPPPPVAGVHPVFFASFINQLTEIFRHQCDEQRPSCRNCLRRGVDCQFLAESGVCPNFLNQNESALALNMLDLKLMHHFSTSTYATLFSSRTVRHFWRGEAVQSALKYDYVMRAMLAVSALHLAHHSPEKREQYISTALTYHRLASREAMSLMSDVDEEHAGSLFLFSVLTIFFALGGPSQPSDGLLLFGESSFPEWLFLLQGTKSLIEMLGPPGSRGPVEPLLAHARQSPLWKDPRPETGDASDMMDAMAELEMLVCSTVDDSEALRIYKYAIKELRMVAMVFLKESQADITDAFTWIYLVLDDFLPLLKVPTQEAIAIFSYFCVLLKKLDMHWWIRGWGDRLIRRAHDMLDSEHKSWIAWPVEEIGCVLST